MRQRPVPPSDTLRAHLEEAGATGIPTDAPDEDHLQGLLALALHVADCQKRVRFDGFSWGEPRFVAEDAKLAVEFPHVRLAARDEAGVRELLLDSLPRVREGRALLAIDARPSGIAEFELGHHLYGRVTLFAHRSRPFESADIRLDRARDRGWTTTLKEHNLLPGRGLVVLDEDHGLLLREPWLDDLLGVLVLFASGETKLWWNPFATRGDPEMQHWTAWGRGTGKPSEWREVLHVTRRDVDES